MMDREQVGTRLIERRRPWNNWNVRFSSRRRRRLCILIVVLSAAESTSVIVIGIIVDKPFDRSYSAGCYASAV